MLKINLDKVCKIKEVDSSKWMVIIKEIHLQIFYWFRVQKSKNYSFLQLMNGKTGLKFSVIKLYCRTSIYLDSRRNKTMVKSLKIRFYGQNLDWAKFSKTINNSIKRLKLIKIF